MLLSSGIVEMHTFDTLAYSHSHTHTHTQTLTYEHLHTHFYRHTHRYTHRTTFTTHTQPVVDDRRVAVITRDRPVGTRGLVVGHVTPPDTDVTVSTWN